MKLIWPFLTAIGLFAVISYSTDGSGHVWWSFGILLILIGVVGGVIDSITRIGYKKTRPLIIAWVLCFSAFITVILSTNLRIPFRGFEFLWWLFASLTLAFTGLLLMLFNLIRK